MELEKMFLKNPKETLGSNHIIIGNRIVFLNDDDNDVLFAGINHLGDIVLASIVYEDTFIRYYHTLVSLAQLFGFMKQQISLRDILRASENFFIVDVDFSGKEIFCGITCFDDIVDDYLPREDSFLPKWNNPAQ